MPTIWGKAVKKQEKRRSFSKKAVHDSPNMEALVAIGTRYHVYDKKGQNTTALGYASYGGLFDPILVLSFKGPPQPDAGDVFLRAQQHGLYLSSALRVRILGNTSGLHSEMAIIKYLTGGMKNHPLLNNDEWLIEIACIGKGVCPDCSGFMAKYGIPHTAARSNVAAQWTNPFTDANYSATGNNLQYRKGGKTFTGILPGAEYEKGWASKMET